MEGQSGDQLWKKRKYGGGASERDELPSFEEVENDGQGAARKDTMMEDEPLSTEERNTKQPFASTSTSRPSDALSSSKSRAPVPRSRFYSTTPRHPISSISTSQSSKSVPSSFESNSQTLSIPRRGPAPVSSLFGEPAKSNSLNPMIPSRKVPLTSEQTKLFNTKRSTGPLRVYSKPSTGGLIAAGGLGPTLSENKSRSGIKERSMKEEGRTKGRNKKSEEGNLGEEQWMELDEVSGSAESDLERARDGSDEVAEYSVDKLNRQFHRRPPSPSSESSSSYARPVSRLPGQPRQLGNAKAARKSAPQLMGKAKAARKSAKVLRISRSESEEEWDDETDGNNGVSEDEELDSEEDEDTMSVIQKKGPSDGIAVAEVRSRLVPQLTNPVPTRQPPISTDQSNHSPIDKTTSGKAAPPPPLRPWARKSSLLQQPPFRTYARKTAPSQSQSQLPPNQSWARKSAPSQSQPQIPPLRNYSRKMAPSLSSKYVQPTSLDPDPSDSGLAASEKGFDSDDRISAKRRIDPVESNNKAEGVPTEILDEAESSDLSRHSSPAAIAPAQGEAGNSDSMVRTRSMDGKTKKPEPSLRQVKILTTQNSKGRSANPGVEKKKWIHLLKIDPEEKRVEVPANWQAPPQPWLIGDPEDSINDCVHDKQLLISFDRYVLCSSSAASYDVSNVVLNVSIESRNTTPGFPSSRTLASTSTACALVLDRSTQHSEPTFRLDVDDSLTSKPLSLPFDPQICRKAGTISLSVLISLQFGSAQLDTRHTICSISSPAESLIPRSNAPFLNFDEPDAQSGMAIKIDVVPLRKQIKSAGEAQLEIERRLARMELERERVWVPDAQAVREGQIETKMIKMLDLGAGSYGCDFETKLPYRPGETIRNFRNDTVENTARFVEAKDEEIHRTSASASEKLLSRAHMRWGLLNPYPRSIFDRELTCWTYYAPLLVHFSLRPELVTLLLTHFLKYHLLSESEIRQILLSFDVEKDKIEKGERRGYDELRREALWSRERRRMGKQG
ncbi:hypothetical protein JCM5353_008340 [Sporobolomyces roseus]